MGYQQFCLDKSRLNSYFQICGKDELGSLIYIKYTKGDLKNCNSVYYFTFYVPTCKVLDQLLHSLLSGAMA